jgi:peptide/nickel transport system permease protein
MSHGASPNPSQGTLAAKDRREAEEQRILVSSQWGLMWLHFKKHRLALLGSSVVVLLYTLVVLGSFLSPYDKLERTEYIYHPPQAIQFLDGETLYLRPFVYGIISETDPEAMRRVYTVDRSRKYFVRIFVRGFEYRLLGLIPIDIHLFGVEEDGQIFLMGTDELGRDLFSRVLSGAAISLSIGFLGVLSSFFLGTILGGVSGYYGGAVDNIVDGLECRRAHRLAGYQDLFCHYPRALLAWLVRFGSRGQGQDAGST